MKTHKFTKWIWILFGIFTIIAGLSTLGICIDEKNGNQYWPVLEWVAYISFGIWSALSILTLLSPIFWKAEDIEYKEHLKSGEAHRN